MKNSNKCPKCGSPEIIKIKGKAGAYGSGNYIEVGIFSTAGVDRYLCCECGYSEEWISKDKLDAIKKKYEKKTDKA